MEQNKKLIIYGNGHMAKMIYQFVKNHFSVVAFTVDACCIIEDSLFEVPVVPFAQVQNMYFPVNHVMLIAIGFLEMNRLRQERYKEGKAKGYRFINYIHPSVIWHDSVSIGENNIILDHASIHPFSSVGSGNFISSNCNLGHGCVVSDHCWINAGVSVGGETKIKNNVFLGINAAVGHNIVLGEKTFVGANTLISRSTEALGVYLSPGGERFRLSSEDFVKFSRVL